MADNLAGIAEAMRQAGEAFADALASVSKSIQGAAAQVGGGDRERLVENWLRIARMSKDGMIAAVEHGFEVWEREVRREASAGKESASAANPAEAWADNLRKATEAIIGSSAAAAFGEDARKQTEAVQHALADGIRAWRRLWEPEQK